MDGGVHSKKKPTTGGVHHLTSPVTSSNQWDSVESDTESLAQENAYQQQMQDSIQHPKLNLIGKEDSWCRNTETESGSKNELEDLQIYDSLEVVEGPHGWKTSVDQLDEREAACRLLSGEKAFSYLSKTTKEEPSHGCRHILVKKGGYSFVIDATIPAVVTDSEQSFHLHPQNSQRDSVTSTDSQLHSQVTDLSAPSGVVDENQSLKTAQRERYEQQRKASVANKKLQQVKDDIVASNKITLGRSTKKQGSYLKKHALKHDVPFKINREEREQQDTSSSLSQLSEQPHVPEMRAELRGIQSALYVTSSPPTFNYNINLHTSPLLSTPQQWGFLSQQDNGHLQQAYLQDLESSPKLRLSPIPGSYKVLPPIEKPVSREDFEQSSEQSASTASDSYLVQMEKKQQLRTRVSYKAYTLKDYKQLKSDIELRGLGPDYSNSEKSAEKMRRQKQYANAIREQNKNINRTPFIPTKESADNDQKVPRMKALEYAKTIAKPLVAQQSKKSQTQRSRGAIEGLNMSELSRLEILKKRHEEEKRAFALLRK